MKRAVILIAGLFVIGCAGETAGPRAAVPSPAEIIDLGALVTERTPEDFWSEALLEEQGFTASNTFDVIKKEFGSVSVSNSYYRLFNHGGPHVDAPNHVGVGAGLDSYPVESFAGPLKVFDFSHLPGGRSISRDRLIDLPIDPGDVVLIYTGYSPDVAEGGWPKVITFTYEAARYLAALPVRAIGTDALSVESLQDPGPVQSDDEIARVVPVHYAFLSQGIPVFEQLVNLDRLLDKRLLYFVGAPLNIVDGDGMMVRPLVLVYRGDAFSAR